MGSRLAGRSSRGTARRRHRWPGVDGLTDLGRQVVAGIEDTTDEVADRAYAVVDDTGSDDLRALLEPITRAVVAAGEIPLDSPMGLDLRPLR